MTWPMIQILHYNQIHITITHYTLAAVLILTGQYCWDVKAYIHDINWTWFVKELIFLTNKMFFFKHVPCILGTGKPCSLLKVFTWFLLHCNKIKVFRGNKYLKRVKYALPPTTTNWINNCNRKSTIYQIGKYSRLES